MGPGQAVVFDSPILIDSLNGHGDATRAIAEAQSSAIYVSVITEIEVLVGARTAATESTARGLLSLFEVVPLDDAIANLTIHIRRATRLKLPDSIILATARHLGCPLVTRNTKDFDRDDPSILVPYEF